MKRETKTQRFSFSVYMHVVMVGHICQEPNREERNIVLAPLDGKGPIEDWTVFLGGSESDKAFESLHKGQKVLVRGIFRRYAGGGGVVAREVFINPTARDIRESFIGPEMILQNGVSQRDRFLGEPQQLNNEARTAQYVN